MLHNVRVQNFRSHDDTSVHIEDNLTIIIGPNASGKTNLLEAIYTASQGHSFRGREFDLIKHGADWARVDIVSEDSSRSVLLEKKPDTTIIQKTFILDDVPHKRLSMHGVIPTVLFEPSNMLLIHGPPELRRAFLDDLLSQTVVGYKSWLSQYKRTLSQRNTLLKQGYNRAKGQLFAWDIRLCDLGARIAVERHKLIELINEQLKPIYCSIAGEKTDIIARYGLMFEDNQYSTKMLKQIEKNQQIDCERGFTSIGPHREDMVFLLHGKQAEQVASRGETRSLILALKIASIYHIEQANGKKPLLLLDDVFAELDINRQKHLTNHIAGHQKIITATNLPKATSGLIIRL